MCPTVHVEDLSSYLICLYQVEHGIDNVFYLSDLPHRLNVLSASLGSSLCRVCPRRRANGIEADSFFCTLDCEMPGHGTQTSLRIIGTEALRPAIGLSASDAEMFTTHPDFCFNICLTVNWVMKKNPSTLIETRTSKSSMVKSVNGLVRQIPALFTRTSAVPKCWIAASTDLAAIPLLPDVAVDEHQTG